MWAVFAEPGNRPPYAMRWRMGLDQDQDHPRPWTNRWTAWLNEPPSGKRCTIINRTTTAKV